MADTDVPETTSSTDNTTQPEEKVSEIEDVQSPIVGHNEDEAEHEESNMTDAEDSVAEAAEENVSEEPADEAKAIEGEAEPAHAEDAGESTTEAAATDSSEQEMEPTPLKTTATKPSGKASVDTKPVTAKPTASQPTTLVKKVRFEHSGCACLNGLHHACDTFSDPQLGQVWDRNCEAFSAPDFQILQFLLCISYEDHVNFFYRQETCEQHHNVSL